MRCGAGGLNDIGGVATTNPNPKANIVVVNKEAMIFDIILTMSSISFSLRNLFQKILAQPLTLTAPISYY